MDYIKNETGLERIDLLVVETKDLAKKINELQNFMRTVFFYKMPRLEKDLLYDQMKAMLDYLQVLGKRIEIANDKNREERERDKTEFIKEMKKLSKSLYGKDLKFNEIDEEINSSLTDKELLKIMEKIGAPKISLIFSSSGNYKIYYRE